jgi:methylglutaconyl-CoA hydratase
MERPLFLEELDDRGVAHIALTRPDKHNAFNADLIAELTTALQGIDSDDRVRCLLLTAEGRSFSAGADLTWMRAMAQAGEAENLADARKLAKLLETLDGLSKPTVALVQGAAIGGGVGLVACCDVVLAAQEAVFALSEVRLGLIPATIQPYVMQAIGPRQATRYTLTAERFGAEEAHRIGLVHEVVGIHGLRERGERVIAELLKGGPAAQAAAKDQLKALRGQGPDPHVHAAAAGRIARIRASAEGQEGIAAFLEKRDPNWRPPRDEDGDGPKGA